METIRVYLDLPLASGLIGWLQDATLLWMVAQICGVRVRLYRLIGGGLWGGLFQFLLMLNQGSDGIIAPWIMSPFIFMLVVPFLMLGTVFYPLSKEKGIRIIGYFYLLSFLLAGVLWGIDSLNRRFLGWEISWWTRFCLHLATILVLGELGWGVVHRKVWERLCLYPIQISWDDRQVRLNALLDTGNRLHDPLTKAPVIVVELSQIERDLPPELIRLVNEVRSSGFTSEWQLPGAWEGRIRLLPFNSLGRDHGLLLGFRPDQLKVWSKKQEFVVQQNVVVGLYDRTLSKEGTFQALIPPAVLQV